MKDEEECARSVRSAEGRGQGAGGRTRRRGEGETRRGERGRHEEGRGGEVKRGEFLERLNRPRFEMEVFLRERREALLSMDRERILAYARRYGIRMPDDEEVFWRAVHKARTGARDLPIEERRRSKEWLEARGSGSLEEGE